MATFAGEGGFDASKIYDKLDLNIYQGKPIHLGNPTLPASSPKEVTFTSSCDCKLYTTNDWKNAVNEYFLPAPIPTNALFELKFETPATTNKPPSSGAIMIPEATNQPCVILITPVETVDYKLINKDPTSGMDHKLILKP